MYVDLSDSKIPFGNNELSGFYSRLYSSLLVEIRCKEAIT